MNEPYKLNNDVQELNVGKRPTGCVADLGAENAPSQRLDVQHRMWSLMLGGLYPSELSAVVERLMMSNESRVMDVGCGSGIWAIEMAERFPKAQIVGLDITPPKYRAPPPNFVFKQHNLINGLPIEYTTTKFDVIHCRCVCQHVPEPQDLVESIAKCIKPGGLILMADGEWIGFDEERKPLEPFVYEPTISIEENIANARRFSSYAGWLVLFGKATRSPKYQLLNKLLGNVDTVGNIAFRELWPPTGWAGKDVPHGQEIGAITYTNMKEFFQTSTAALLGQGVPSAVVDAMRERAIEELSERRHTLWYYTSAIAMDELGTNI